ncbi:iron ABC transporter substrate-binding protein [Parafrigoribacterium mesophilum]|uniref:iron ABC transporter substrate-binding protein n=1 Tax=Parafrigoribacterium mesophilum TaxID=433646 RepID=UPI0031FE1BB4
MRAHTTTTTFLAVSAVLALTLTGCASNAPSATPAKSDSLAGTQITVYNGQHEELTQAWADAFTAESGVKVVLRNANESELANQIVQEGAASPADVFLTENSPAIALVENKKLLAPVNAATLQAVPAQFRPSTDKWTGIAARSTVFVYNPTLLEEDQLPKSLLDLAGPQWQGRWAASPGGADFQAIVSALLELKGPDATLEWLTGMKKNFSAYKGNSTVMKAVNAGDIPAGVIYHYYWFADQSGTKENSSNTKLYYFKNEDPGAFVSVSGGGVLASSKHQAAAQAFLKFIVGEAGQKVLQTGTSFEYPVASDVAANPALPALDSLEAPAIDPTKLNSPEVADLMTRAGLI